MGAKKRSSVKNRQQVKKEASMAMRTRGASTLSHSPESIARKEAGRGRKVVDAPAVGNLW